MQMEGVRDTGGVGGRGHGDLDGRVRGELDDRAGRKEVLGRLGAAQDLEEDGNRGRRERRAVRVEGCAVLPTEDQRLVRNQPFRDTVKLTKVKSRLIALSTPPAVAVPGYQQRTLASARVQGHRDISDIPPACSRAGAGSSRPEGWKIQAPRMWSARSGRHRHIAGWPS